MFSRQGVSRWSFQVTAKFISLLTYRLLGYICLSITANVCAIYWMTRKWSWRHRKFHKIRYIGFLKKLTRCEYELSRPSRSRETAADVIFTFHKFFTNFWKKILCLFWFLSVTQSYFHGLKSTQINVKMALLESFWFFICTAEN